MFVLAAKELLIKYICTFQCPLIASSLFTGQGICIIRSIKLAGKRFGEAEKHKQEVVLITKLNKVRNQLTGKTVNIHLAQSIRT